MISWLKKNWLRLLMSLFGVLIGGVCVGFFRLAAFGVDPFQSLMSGLEKLIPINGGTLYVIVNAVLLVFSLCTDRKNIGVATFINLFLLGYVVSFTESLLRAAFPDPGMALRLICLIGSFVILSLGASMYMTAALGVSTYDAVAIVMSEKWKVGQFRYIRICTDFLCVALGVCVFLLGGGHIADVPSVAGIGTIMTAFFMGPLIAFFNEKVSEPLLYGKKAK